MKRNETKWKGGEGRGGEERGRGRERKGREGNEMEWKRNEPKACWIGPGMYITGAPFVTSWYIIMYRSIALCEA